MKFYKKLPIICITMVVAFFSCKKDPVLKTALPVPDNIYHKVLSPFVILNPIKKLVAHGSGCGYVYSPYDSLATFDLDLDSNGVIDLHFSSKSYYEFHSASYPCVNYLRSTSISVINTNDYLGLTPSPNNYQTYYYSSGDIVGVSTNFSNYSNFSGVFSGASTEPIAIHGGDFYLPLKRVLNNKIMYGWIKIDTIGYGGIIIKEYAINNTNGNNIICGQTY